MRQAVVVRLIADVFSISQETPTRDERLVAEQIKDEFNTLMINDDDTDDEEIESDFGDDTSLAGGTTLLPERSLPVVEHHESSSSSSYAPSPPEKPLTKFPDNQLAAAYKIWTKQRRGRTLSSCVILN